MPFLATPQQAMPIDEVFSVDRDILESNDSH